MVDVTYQMVLSTIQTASLVVGIIYYLTIMGNQQKTRELAFKAQEQALETRQAQYLTNLMNTFSSTEFRRQWHTLWRIEWKDFDDFKERFHGKDVEVMSAYTSMMTYYESVGILVKSGLIDISKVYLLLAGGIKMTWERYLPLIMGDRVEFEEYDLLNRKRWENFEFLYGELIQFDQKQLELDT